LDNKKKDCPGCGRKQNIIDAEIDFLISQQLEMEVGLVGDEIRDERLVICANCPFLLGPTCIKCGCFAKFRASLEIKNCPVSKW